MRKNLSGTDTYDVVGPEAAGTLAGLFRERVRRTPKRVAYRQYDRATDQWTDMTWSEMASEVARWQAAMLKEALEPGDRVAIMLHNCREWVMFEQAALGCGLVVVPLYTEDRPENVAYILQNAGVKLLFIEGEHQWNELLTVRDELGFLTRIVTMQPVKSALDSRLTAVTEWVSSESAELIRHDSAPDKLATIVYTSGTTGRPKGVMLSHDNILNNAYASQKLCAIYLEDLFLSFLPLSHTFERTIGYYLPMMAGASVAYNRSIPELADDLLIVRPTILISVPRIFERVYNKIYAQLQEKPPAARKLFEMTVKIGWARFERAQGRGNWNPSMLLWPLLERLVAGKIMAKLGGRMRIAVCGGAPLSEGVARLFVGLGLRLLQGYGLTETSPVIAANPPDDNQPASVGVPLPGVEVKVGENQELLVRGHGIMLGYWDNPKATAEMIDDEGWLHTGDKVRIEDNHIYITGRLKEILVLATGEKVPPADMEMAIAMDPLFEQVMVVGDNRPYLSALVVLNQEMWAEEAKRLGVVADDPEVLNDSHVGAAMLERLVGRITAFPGYAQIRHVTCLRYPWTIDEGLITPTMKLRRRRILERFSNVIDEMYSGH
jgi:long-chain acyl-CoA synthetase